MLGAGLAETSQGVVRTIFSGCTGDEPCGLQLSKVAGQFLRADAGYQRPVTDRGIARSATHTLKRGNAAVATLRLPLSRE